MMLELTFRILAAVSDLLLLTQLEAATGLIYPILKC